MMPDTQLDAAARMRGFSLVELLATVVILSILASVAIPSYMDQMRKSRRGEGKAVLTQIAVMQEQFRTEQNRYTTDLTQLGFAASGWNITETGIYRASVLAATGPCPIATCFQLEVQPVAGSRQEKDKWIYQLWSDGRKRRKQGASGSWVLDWKQ